MRKYEGLVAGSFHIILWFHVNHIGPCLQLREREAALEALRAAHVSGVCDQIYLCLVVSSLVVQTILDTLAVPQADIKKPLDVPQNITLPLPQGNPSGIVPTILLRMLSVDFIAENKCFQARPESAYGHELYTNAIIECI